MIEESSIEAVADLFAAYESALMSDAIDDIQGFFWPDATRYGTDGNQRTGAEIDAARRRPHAPLDRHIHNTLIRSAGPECVIAETEFTRRPSGAQGRQSQVWLRRAGEWKIMHAHVSMLPTSP
jgi:hypothetical protein